MNGKSSLNEKHAATILKELLKFDKSIYLSSLQSQIKNYYALQNTVLKLAEEGYIKITETEYRGRPAKLISLTPKGRVVAEKLKEAENVANMTPEELEEERKNIHWIVDINTFVDHITAYDIHNGKKEIFNIWLKANGKYLLLYCDKCNSYDCYHVDWALHDPVISPELKKTAEKKGLKIKNLEENGGADE